MTPLAVTVILCLGRVKSVSVDPDMEMEMPMQAETEDVFVFPSMRMNPLSLDVKVNYRGMPPQHALAGPKETERGGGVQTPVTRRANVMQGFTLKPGAGSWNFNSIEDTAKKGLPPTHVPKTFSDAPSDLLSESSKTVYSTPSPKSQPRDCSDTLRGCPQKARQPVNDSPGSHRHQKPTIPPFYKQILKNSNDYQHWLQLKNIFLRERKMLFAKTNLQAGHQPLENVPIQSGSNVQPRGDNDNNDKFPHFPDKVHTVVESNGVGKDIRPQREIKVNLHSAPPVYKEGGTLYRAPTSKPHSVQLQKSPQRTTTRRPSPVQVSSLRTTRHPGATYSSPLYPHSPGSPTQFFTTPQPPLPPGYELVPVDQLTDDHEVVPWEDLPHLMKKHNLSLNHIPLGPFQHPTPTHYPNYSQTPYTSYTTPYKHLLYSPSPSPFSNNSLKPNRNHSPTPKPNFSTTKKPFTAFSPTPGGRYSPTPKYGSSHMKYYPTKGKNHHISPFIPPPVSPDISHSMFPEQEDQSGYHSPNRRPSISNQSYKAPKYKNKNPSQTVKPKSIHFGTNFAKLPKNGQKKTSSATYRYNPTTAPTQENLAHTPSLISYTTKHPSSTLPTLGRFSPKSNSYSTTAAPFFESTKIPKPTYYPRPVHNQLSTTVRYTSRGPTVRYSQKPTHAPTHSYHSSTTVRNNYRTPTTTTYLNVNYNVPNSTPVPNKPIFPPSMPKFLPPPNNPLPTYFDVSTLVPPTPPIGLATQKPQRPESQQSFRPKAPHSITPVPIFHMPAANPKRFVGPRRPPPHQHSLRGSPPPIILQGRLNTQGKSADPPHIVFPANVIHPQENPRVKFVPTLKPANFNQPTQQAIVTKAVAVFRPNFAVPRVTGHTNGQFEHFTQKTGPSIPVNQINTNTNTNEHLNSEQPEFVKESLFTGPKPDKRLIALTTLRPDLATKYNRNKMRSSTHKNTKKKKIGRLNLRPHKQQTSPNFHPIQPRPNGGDTLVPQARPNVPVSETDHTGGMRPEIPKLLADNRDKHLQSKVQTTPTVPTDRSVLSNNNNGIWFIEEKMKDFDEDKPLKREFSESNNRTTINPAITERPRTWPASLKTSAPKQNDIYDDVTIIERSKNGETEQKFTGKTIESTTFSTSRVQVSSSTTPAPNYVKGGHAKDLMKLMKRKRLNNLENDSQSALKDLMLGKGKKLLYALQESKELNDNDVIVNNRGKSPNSIVNDHSSSERDRSDPINEQSRHDALKNAKLGRLRRKKLRQRAKALATAIEDMEKEEPYIVFPMDKRNTENKGVDEIFDHKNHPGLTRISAYDFEAMERAREQAEQSISRPVAELKVSIEDLANTMSKLSKSVTETTTKKDTESDKKISQLQEEIAKLTRTLENLKLAPPTISVNKHDKSQFSPNIVNNRKPQESEILRPSSSQISHAQDKIDLGDTDKRPRDSQESGSINVQKTWLSKGNWEIVDSDNPNDGQEVAKKPEKLEIIEVYTLPTKQSPNPMRKWRTTVKPRPTRTTTVQTRLEPSRRPVSTTPKQRNTEQKWFIKPSLSSNNVFENNRGETSTMKHPTNDNDISNFFGSTKEKDFGLHDVPTLSDQEANDFFQPQVIKPEPNNAQFDKHGNMRDINNNKPRGGVLGLFEMMGKINKEATDNFDVIKLPNKEDNRNQELRFQEIRDKMRLEQIDKLKAEEEELRAQQREKLKLFHMIQEEEEKAKKQEKLLLQKKQSTLNSFDSLQGWTNEKTWAQTITEDRRRGQSSQNVKEEPNTAFASITIENVDVNDARDYEVNNGIVKLRKDNTGFETDVSDEYEYEYYVADPDDIKFPVGGTKQFYEAQTEKVEANVNQLSNKELLLNLLQASNNFQNREFLDRLKSIVTGTSGDNTLESLSVEDQNYIQNNLMKQNNRFGQGSVTLLKNKLKGLGEESNTRSVLRSFDVDSWAPTSNQLTPKPTKLINNLNNLPIWPSSNSFKPPKDELSSLQTSNSFEPVSNPIRFPNRRIDSGFGVGEVALVTGNERKKVTSLSGFQTAPVSSPNSYMSDSRISDKLDTTSDQEFVVGTSLSMNRASPNDSTKHSNTNIGYATPIPNIGKDNNSYRTGTATPVKNSGYSRAGQQSSRSGSEVFRLGSGIQIQQPGHMGQTTATNNQNYILPTYTNDHQFQYGLPANRNMGEIYSDIRVESGKKNLLTLPTDPNSLYIKSTPDRPEAEVIVYPMGQLLTNSNHQQITSNDGMIMSGSAEVVSQDLPARTRDQIPVYHLSQDVSDKLDADTELYDPRQEANSDTKPPPKGILQTLIRSAKDDLNFAGNVINFLTRS
eukprot:TRINITY_DN24050_c0_g1_i1.p1 TRINITY_DN24050_c0_g1~~TRINITY_DN24050_c0_g1_i1.p1  ORF type:complete len:2302 (-),score=417.30 TRINITY_DN24050_c0_g1_i1:127-7032(-)